MLLEGVVLLHVRSGAGAVGSGYGRLGPSGQGPRGRGGSGRAGRRRRVGRGRLPPDEAGDELVAGFRLAGARHGESRRVSGAGHPAGHPRHPAGHPRHPGPPASPPRSPPPPGPPIAPGSIPPGIPGIIPPAARRRRRRSGEPNRRHRRRRASPASRRASPGHPAGHRSSTPLPPRARAAGTRHPARAADGHGRLHQRVDPRPADVPELVRGRVVDLRDTRRNGWVTSGLPSLSLPTGSVPPGMTACDLLLVRRLGGELVPLLQVGDQRLAEEVRAARSGGGRCSRAARSPSRRPRSALGLNRPVASSFSLSASREVVGDVQPEPPVGQVVGGGQERCRGCRCSGRRPIRAGRWPGTATWSSSAIFSSGMPAAIRSWYLA